VSSTQCSECSAAMSPRNAKLVMWHTGAATTMACHVCGDCFSRFKAQGMGALPKCWHDGGAQTRAELNKRASGPLT
jgi:hypothetical protein